MNRTEAPATPYSSVVLDAHPDDATEALAFMLDSRIRDVTLARWLRTRPGVHPFIMLLSAVSLAAWTEVEPLLNRLRDWEFDRTRVLHDCIDGGRPMNVHVQRDVLRRLVAECGDRVDYDALFARAVRAKNVMAVMEWMPRASNTTLVALRQACEDLDDKDEKVIPVIKLAINARVSV